MKKIVIALLVLIFSTSTAFAEISQSIDKYNNISTIKSKTAVPISDKAELNVLVIKTYSTVKVGAPTVPIDFLVTAPEYWFFSKTADYLVDGDPIGKRLYYTKTGHSFPQAGLVGAWAYSSLYPADPLASAIFNNKPISFRLSFLKQSSFEYKTPPDVVEEWKTVLLFTPPAAKQ